MVRSPTAGSRPGAVLLLLAIALGPVLSAVPTARAAGESVEVQDPIVLQGEASRFRVHFGVPETALRVEVSCIPCGPAYALDLASPEGRTATGQGFSDLQFPYDFPAALFAREPRHEATYRIRVESAGVLLAQGSFDVRLTDAHTRNGVVETTDMLLVRSVGHAAGSEATLTLRSWAASGALTTLGAFRLIADGQGIVQYRWLVPKHIARERVCPERGDLCSNATVELSSGKGVERSAFRIKPATIAATILRAPGMGGEPDVVTRTELVPLAFRLSYHNGPVLPEDFFGGAPEVLVERREAGGGATVVARVPARWQDQSWRLDWDVPRNATLTLAAAPTYRFVMATTADRYGNAVVPTASAPFGVREFTFEPGLLEHPPERAERGSNLTVLYELRYANGQPFTHQDNASALRVALLNAGSNAEVRRADAVHVGEGRWRAQFHLPPEFSQLGNYTIRLSPARDRDGNAIPANLTPVFEVGTASIHLAANVSVGGEPRGGDGQRPLSRGDTFLVTVRGSYADGTVFNASRARDDLVLANFTRPDGTSSLHALRETDPRAGIFAGRIAIPCCEAPIGPWTLALSARDGEREPNVARATLLLAVEGYRVPVRESAPPPPTLRAGVAIDWRFRLSLPDGTSLTPSDMNVLGVRLVRGADREPVRTLPLTAQGGEWVARFASSSDERLDLYRFRVEGSDLRGNIVDGESTAFSLVSEARSRDVLSQPPASIVRGERAHAIFRGAVGDRGPEGGAPRIEWQTFDEGAQAWVVHVRDVRVNDSALTPDHFGVAVTSERTPLGLHRLVLVGQAAGGAVLSAETRTFVVEATGIVRPLAGEPPTEIVKGETLRLLVTRRDGDRVDDVRMESAAGRTAGAVLSRIADRFVLSWTPHARIPGGLWTITVFGSDLDGNRYETAHAVRVIDLALAPELQEEPSEFVRGGTAVVRFTLRYPDSGGFLAGDGTPVAIVLGAVGAKDDG
ncbi:MAG TPA: hypothetical protein VM681_05375, partial [Candidatus Thermoplasmatota archaeon]|nr:hypothetical protein [Candidatus Thermoplasmatota archaeon]